MNCHSESDLIASIQYPPNDRQPARTPQGFFRKRGILTARNDDVRSLNSESTILARLPDESEGQ